MIHEHKERVVCCYPSTKDSSSQSCGGHNRNVSHWLKPWSGNLHTHWTRIGSNIEKIAKYIVNYNL